MRARVLVADDEWGMRKSLSRGLAAQGMDVALTVDGPSALRAARTGAFDIVLLDIMLPGLSGYRVLKQLRDEGVQTPVLLVSAKSGEYDQADGYDLGADGYLIKPFSYKVLVSQINRLLSRVASDAPRQLVRVGELEVDRARRQVRWSGSPLELSPREYAVLDVLAGRAGAVVTKDDLLRAVWGDELAATRNAVEVYAGYLRRKLEAAGAVELLQTVRGHGYLISTTELDAALVPVDPGDAR